MKKLEDIPKQNIFNVPEGYFDQLPQVIQSRISKPKPEFWKLPVFRYSVSMATLIIIGFTWWNLQKEVTIEDQLGKIETDQLIAYLDDADVTSEFLTEEFSWSENDLNELEESVFSTMDYSISDLDLIESEINIDSVNM